MEQGRGSGQESGNFIRSCIGSLFSADEIPPLRAGTHGSPVGMTAFIFLPHIINPTVSSRPKPRWFFIGAQRRDLIRPPAGCASVLIHVRLLCHGLCRFFHVRLIKRRQRVFPVFFVSMIAFFLLVCRLLSDFPSPGPGVCRDIPLPPAGEGGLAGWR